MATNANVNKVIVNNQTLIDLTGDTITATDVINGKQFHDKSGAVLTGTSTYDADTSDAVRFYPQVGRFPEIEEDEAPLYLLVNEYPAAK